MKQFLLLLVLASLAGSCSQPTGQTATANAQSAPKKTDAVTGRWTLVYYYSRQDDLVKTPETMNEIYYYEFEKGKLSRNYDPAPASYTLDAGTGKLCLNIAGQPDTMALETRGDTLILQGDTARITYRKLVLVRVP